MKRKYPIVTDQIYHIFNRGVNKGKIYFSADDYRRFWYASVHYKTKSTRFSFEKHWKKLNSVNNDTGSQQLAPRVEIMAYCLMPNHFHFLVRQLVDDGITAYFRFLSNSYSHYIHSKYGRVGPLFEGRFKNVLVDTDYQLLHVSRYIHLNPLVANLVDDLEKYPWSSYLSYIEGKDDPVLDSGEMMQRFKGKRELESFTLDQAEYGRELERFKHLAIDL